MGVEIVGKQNCGSIDLGRILRPRLDRRQRKDEQQDQHQSRETAEKAQAGTSNCTDILPYLADFWILIPCYFLVE